MLYRIYYPCLQRFVIGVTKQSALCEEISRRHPFHELNGPYDAMQTGDFTELTPPFEV
jgi:hypothetical protein